jgi:ubiquinol-cytochrome c reductase cytochrome c1 subunit
MGKLRSLLAGVFTAGLLAAPAVAQEADMPNERWSFSSVFGTFDLAAAQRGFEIYSNVCSNCHSMKLLHYRDLSGIGLDEGQIKAIAASSNLPSPMTSPHALPMAEPCRPICH